MSSASNPALRFGCACALAALALMTVGAQAQAASPDLGSTGARWLLHTPKGSHHLQIYYGSGRNFPQYADLDKSAGEFRMVYTTACPPRPPSCWGTSVFLLPALWSMTSCPTDYCQGAPVTVTHRLSGADLVLSVRGTIATLKVTVTVTLVPPAHGRLVARVFAKVTGTVKLDGDRPGEAFKPVMLASMHDSSTTWDSSAAFTGTRVRDYPSSGWIIPSPFPATRDFGLQGGTSSYKKNAPTIEVILNKSRTVTGWLTADPNANDDNVGFWCAAGKVLKSWSYSLTAEAGNHL